MYMWYGHPNINPSGCFFAYILKRISIMGWMTIPHIHTYTMLDHSTHGNFHAYVQTNPHGETERMN